MPSLIITTREGEQKTVEGEIGLSLMEVIRNAGVYELLALCGGCCSCATCHIYIDEDHLARLPAIGEDEGDLLESSNHRKASSRLACQIPFTEALHGLAVQVAPEN